MGYGVGDLGCNLVFGTMASYLMFFYTDVFGITAAAAGTLMLVTKIIDAFADTGMGLIVDRTHTRWGQGGLILSSELFHLLFLPSLRLSCRIPE